MIQTPEKLEKINYHMACSEVKSIKNVNQHIILQFLSVMEQKI